ncbi:MAG: hypothetical protein P8J29_09500, partial [Rhodospirillales bacterium]|nr:hypothetical protein [Rhodospirillales bacterium]
MNIWQNCTAKQRDAVFKEYEQRALVDELESNVLTKDAKQGSLSLGDVYKFVTGRLFIDTSELNARLKYNSLLKDHFSNLLDQMNLYHSPRLAAASSGIMDTREGDDFKLKIMTSLSDPDQIFVTIELYHTKSRNPSNLIVKSSQDNFHTVELQEFESNIYQIIEEAGNSLISALRDPGSEV